jgi:3',5'-cyclic AMP phosphodiesterase CpdA
MIPEAFDRHEIQRYVSALQDKLDAPELRDAVASAGAQLDGGGTPAQKLRAALPDEHAGPASDGGEDADSVPFLARDPMVSLLQSSLDSKLRERGVKDDTPAHHNLLCEIVHTVESVLDPVKEGPLDDEWVIQVGKSMLERVAEGNHPFNPVPATHQISDDARVVIVGDWGSGLPRARAVAAVMAEEIADARAHGREAHVIHLGDVYYSGTDEEYRRNVLAPGFWPVSVEQAREGVSSWSLNGNHDMYGGGFGYFGTLLADERFARQHSPDGKPTSFFRLTSPSWDFVALDTSWDPDVLALGEVGLLEDPQDEFVAKVAAESDRKLVLLSHHQLLSVYDPADIGPTLASKLAPVLHGGRVTAWLWGHEHRCMGFEAAGGVEFPRCIGHGGVPVLMEHDADEPIPSPGAWEERGYLKEEGDRWARFGFAILDIDHDHIAVRYRDDQGTVVRSETIS